jgi:hypothetical protein
VVTDANAAMAECPLVVTCTPASAGGAALAAQATMRSSLP